MAGTLKRERQLARERYERQQARRRAAAARRRRMQQVTAVALAVVLVIGGVVVLAQTLGGDGGTVTASDSTSPSPTDGATSASPSPTTDGPCAYQDAAEASRDVGRPTYDEKSGAKPFTATIVTNRGDITVEMAADKAPCTTTSFRHLAEQKYFDGTDCHRLTTANIFVLQCGDPTGTGSGGPGYQFGEENLPGDAQNNYPAGTVAMANAGAGTNGSQFFLVYRDTTLPPNYTIFGTITDGLDVVTKVADAGSDNANGEGDGKPNTKVSIERVRIGKA